MNEQQKQAWELLKQAAIGYDDYQYAADSEEEAILQERFNKRMEALLEFCCPPGKDMIDMELSE